MKGPPQKVGQARSLNQRPSEKNNSMNSDESTLNIFREIGFHLLTEIQRKAIPVINRRKNCILVAPTGSGKTESAVIPIFSLLREPKPLSKSIRAIYVTPLRALNNDVFRRIIDYAKKMELEVQLRHGDTTQKARRKLLSDPPDILITTPESLGVLLTNQKILQSLKNLEWIVVDEVHELISNERGAHLSLSLERLESNSLKLVVRIGLSATISNVDEASKFVSGVGRECAILVDKTIRNYDVDVKYVEGTISNIANSIVEYIKTHDIRGSVLLFTNTRDEAEYIGSVLRNLQGVVVDVHHGSLSREMREDTEKRLRSGMSGIVVCTSSLELGLDIGSVELVIHFGSPRQVSKLVQRIGRSRHNSPSSAKGLIVSSNYDDVIESMAILKRVRRHSLESQALHHRPLDVLAHHLVGLVINSPGPKSLQDAFRLFSKAYPFKDLTFNSLQNVINLLDRCRIIRYQDADQTFRGGMKSYTYYFNNLSTIPHILKFEVMDIIRKRRIGTLDQQFIGEYGEKGNVFVLKGSQWRIINVDEKKMQVHVEQIQGSLVNIPHWVGEMIPVDYETAKEVGSLRKSILSDGKAKIIPGYSDILRKLTIVPDSKNIVVERVSAKNSIIIHSTFGTKVNNTLASLFSTIISSQIGYFVEAKTDPYRIMLSSCARIGRNHIQNVFSEEYDTEAVLITSLGGTYNLNWRVWNVAKKFGIVDKEARYDKRLASLIYERYSKTPLSEESIRELMHDKYDTFLTNSVMKDVRNGTINLHWFDLENFTPLAYPITEHESKFTSSPMSIERGIIELLKERLEKTKHRLICIRCGKWERLIETKEISGLISCKVCGSRLITATFSSDYDLTRIIANKLKGTKISTEEDHKFDRAWKVASLINNFGAKALLVLSGYGVGVDTAARILRNLVEDEEILKTIYNAERQYVTTRAFWKEK
jgi:ATP-dependent helicase Lhr and Lhr-like helicase